MSTKIRIATCSPGTQSTTAQTLELVARIAQRAAAQHADLVLLPEAFIGGYPRGTHFGCQIGSRSDQGRNEFLQYFQGSVDLGDTVGDGAGAGDAWVKRELPDDEVALERTGGEVRRGDGTRERLESIARETGVFIVAGLIERAGGSLYCSVVYVCPKLGMIGKRRKVQPTATERLIWAQGSPATLRAVSTVIKGVRINLAAAICWENYVPLLRQALYSQNINLYLAPTADGRDTWLSLMRSVGIEGRCFVVSSNMCVRSSDSPTSGQNGTALKANGQGADVAKEGGPTKVRLDTETLAARRNGSSAIDESYDIALPRQRTGTSISPQRSPRSTRRKSVYDADGNEIVLCCDDDGVEKPTSQPSETQAGNQQSEAPQKRTRSRRKSVYDEDGHEIVLSCNEDSADHEASKEGTMSSGSQNRTRSRRKSVFDADGNEIVLCCDENGTEIHSCAKKTTEFKTKMNGQAKTASSTKAAFISRGGSCIVSPSGEVLAGPQWEDEEGLIYADVDFDDCIRGRLDLDVAGHYSRNDSFKFSVQGLDLSPLPY